MKILSVDAETNGLYGQPFAIGAVCTVGEYTADVYLARCPIPAEYGPDPWVAANVLPALDDVIQEIADYPSLLADFAAWYDEHSDGAVVIAHCGVPVEARLFADFVHVLHRDPFSGPFPLHDLATLLYAAGFDPTSADGYWQGWGLDLGPGFAGMSPHNPLYDARAAEVCWRHLTDMRPGSGVQ